MDPFFGIGTSYRPTPPGCVIGLIALVFLAFGLLSLYGVVLALIKKPEEIGLIIKFAIAAFSSFVTGLFLIRWSWKHCIHP